MCPNTGARRTPYVHAGVRNQGRSDPPEHAPVRNHRGGALAPRVVAFGRVEESHGGCVWLTRRQV